MKNKTKITNIITEQETMPVGASIARPQTLENDLNEKHNQAGITLIALIITIIVLLILASITINLTLGERGIFNTAKKAVENYKNAEEKELADLNNFEQEAGNVINGIDNPSSSDDTTVKLKVEVGKKAENATTIDGKEGNYQNPTIPKEYYPVNTEEAKWDTEGGAQYDNGLVITDSIDISGNPNGNEWVWVPVTKSELAGMYETSSEGIAITGGPSLNVISGVKTNIYSKSGIISGQTRVLPNDTSSFREPDVVVGKNGAQYDVANYSTAGFTSLTNMAQTMVNEYSEMLKSIEKYGGFYIGRYELTANGEKAGATLTNTNWYNLYARCKTLTQANSNTITRMIWGCQWDVTCNWIAKNPKYSITDSSSWGNYSNTEVKSSDGSRTIKASGAEQKLDTGITTFTRAKNIYDIAGNCYEWTQEGSGTYCRDNRGGSYNYNGSSRPASYPGGNSPTDIDYGNIRFSCHINIEPIILINIL